MVFKYSLEDPKWTQATWVQAATPDGSYVNVKSNFGNGHEFNHCKVGWHNRFMDKSKSDVTVETQEYGWLRIWFNNTDVLPFVKENAPSSIPGILSEYCWKHDHPGGWDCSVCLGSTSPKLYVYVGPPETPYEQPCIHCHEAEAVQPTLYCQPCLDALGQEWLKNYEIGLLHSTLPAFAEATAMMGAYDTDWRTLLGNQADLDVYQIWNDRWNAWLDGYSLSESEVGK